MRFLGDRLLVYLLAFAIVLIAALMAFGIAALLHLQGTAYLVFVILILLIGVAAAVVVLVVHFRAKKRQAQEGDNSGSAATAELDLLLDDANRKLRTSQQGGKTLDALPLIYILGDAGSAKTTTVVKSGLDPELVAGYAPDEGQQVPTQILNLWYTKLAVLLEAGATVRQSNPLLSRLVERTRAKAYRSAFGTGAAPRAAIVCVSAEQLLVADGGASVLASARATGNHLREMSRLLGMPLPVYVIVTKLDRVPHFEEYVRNLSDAEVRQVLGSPLPRSETSSGTYVDQATRMLTDVLDGLSYKLGEFRVEMLDRETEPRNVPGVYEFPREFGKLRKNLTQYLVELCKPSQLSANPYLRGFYFTGIRARIVERMATAPANVEQRAPQDAGATQFLNLLQEKLQAASRSASPGVMVSSRVPQWTFLPRLLPEIILGDKSALSPTRQTAPARLFRRILFGTLAFLFAVYAILLVISYFHNATLEHRIANAARLLPVVSSTSTSLPSLTGLHALDELRQTIVQLDTYRHDGPPWSYRFGLYQGDKLSIRARRIYFDRFRPMLLNPAQANFVSYMRALPDAPATNSDSSYYVSAYNPLKAYLITTSRPEKSQPKFLTPVFLQYWVGGRQVDSDQQRLAQDQIDFYANELLRQPPYAIQPDSAIVEHTQGFLSKFLAETRIYQAMRSDAEKTNPSINFNKQFPGSEKSVVDGYTVHGAFTRASFGFMQDAIKHPGKYAEGESWVLGEHPGQSLDSATVTRDLAMQYSADYIKEWHSFLTSAHVLSCGSIREAPGRISALAGAASPLLELLFTVSHNTFVDDPQIKGTFQPAWSLVDPNATERYIGPGNKPYMDALLQLSVALEQVAPNPAATTDQAVWAPVLPLVSAAKTAAQQASQGFNVDQQMRTGGTVLDLLQAPIDCVSKLAPSPGAAANGGGAKICGAITPLLGKFPFAANSNVPASLPEVDATFAPDTGAFWSVYNATLKQHIVPQGSQYVQSPAAPQPVSSRFLQYFNRAAHISSGLYSANQKSAAFSFTLRFLPGTGVAAATWVVDGQRIPNGSTTQEFRWNGASAQKASLEVESKEVLPYQGTWSLFQLVHTGTRITRIAGGFRIDYPIDTSTTTTVAGRTISGSGGGAKTASFEVTGPGAEVFAPDYFNGLQCALPVVK